MGYRIEYGDQGTIVQRKEKSTTRKGMRWLYVAIVILTAVALLKVYWGHVQGQRSGEDLTVAAAESFFEDISAGNGIESAFATFCRRIIYEEIS